MKAIKRQRLKEVALSGLVVLVLVLTFALLPIPGGVDWETFYAAAERVWTGQPLYGEEVVWHSHFYNPPWVAVLLAPLALLPFRWGWAVVSVATLILVTAVVRRWRGGYVRVILVLLSPPMLYTLLHGEIDGLVLGGLLLPQQYWILVALSKPQVAFGLMFGIPRKKWLPTVALTGSVMLVSLLWFGNWPLEILRQPKPLLTDTWNLWLGLWPYQVPAGVALLLFGLSRRDERLLVSASPFLFPYATISSLLGPWAAVCTFLTEWQAVLVLASWWAATVYRAFV